MSDPTSVEERFVELLYEGVLKRTPDPNGFLVNLGLLGREPHFRNACNLLETFVQSSENRRLYSINHTAKPPMSDDDCIDSIVSIGSHCATSFTLKKFRLKQFSGPFDWIFSSLDMVSDCVEDNFSKFLDMQYYRTIPPQLRVAKDANYCDHMFYKEKYGINSIFNHSDPNDPKVYSYLCRCVDRFRKLIISGRKNLLFSLCSHERGDEDSFERICLLLQKHSGISIVVVLVQPSSETLEHEFRLVKEYYGNKLYRFRPTSGLGPVSFRSLFDELTVKRLLDTLPLAEHQHR